MRNRIRTLKWATVIGLSIVLLPLIDIQGTRPRPTDSEGLRGTRPAEGSLAVTVQVTPSHEIPRAHSLAQNYPNPFNAGTVIKFNCCMTESNVTLVIYNILGQPVAKLVSGQAAAGEHSVSWDGKDDRGNLLSSGIYLYRMTAGGYSRTMKLVILR